jgi:hypothetical protein
MMKNNIKNIMIQYIDYLNEYVLNDFISVAETQEIHMIINELISDIPNSKNLYIDDNTIKNSDFCIHAGSHIYVGNNEQIQTANDLLDIQAIVEETGSYNITITSNITYGLLISPTMYANISMLNDNLICAPTIKNDKGDASAFGIVVGKKSQNFNDSYSGDFLIVNNNFNCSISTTLAKPYGVYIKSIASNVYIGIDKSSFSIYAKYNNAYGMYIKTTKSKSLNISGL